MTSGAISIGPSADTVTGNRISLSDAANMYTSAQQIHRNNNSLNGFIVATYERDAALRNGQPLAPFRPVSVEFTVRGASESVVRSNLHSLQKVLKQARDSTKLGALGAPVVLVWQADGNAPETYIDVTGGRVDVLYGVGERYKGGQPVRLTLTVRPFFRQDQSGGSHVPTVTIATSSTISDCVGTYRIADQGAEADGPLRLTVTDLSTSGKIINRLRIGRRSQYPLAVGDFTPVLTPTFVAPGTSFSDATARGGATPRLTGTTSNWQTFASAAQPGTGASQGGEVYVWGRVRDNSPYILATDTATAPTATTATTAATLQFHGGTPYGVTFSTLTSIPIGNASYTISAWFKSTNATPTYNLVTWGAVGANTETALQLGTGTVVAFWGSTGLTATIAVTDGKWHHLVTTWNGTNRRVYVDGLQAAADTPAAHASTSTLFSLMHTTASPTSGDELGPVRIYSTDIGATGVARLYTGQGTADITTGLVGFYQFLEPSGTTITDTAGNNTGTLQSDTTRSTDAVPTAGTLPPDTYYARVSATDSAGVESAAGYPLTVTLPQAASGLYDTLSTGDLSNWDNSGWSQFYRGTTNQTAGAGQAVAIPDASYDGIYGFRAHCTTSTAWVASTPDVYRTIIQKTAQGVAVTASGTCTVYGKFRVNQIITPDGVVQPFISFFSAAIGGSTGTVVGISPDYTSVGTSATPLSSILGGLRFIGGDLWQVCVPYGGASAGGAWSLFPNAYYHITNGNWYSFACSMTASYQGTPGQYKLTCNYVTIDGVQVVGALTQTATSSFFPTAGSALIPTVGTVLYGPNSATLAYDLNDILEVDFDDVGAEQSLTLGSIALTWPAVTNAASYTLYYTPVENPTTWGRVVLGNVTSTTLSTPVATSATLPQARLSGIVAPAYVRVLVLPPNAAAVGGIPSQGGQPVVAQSNWEWCLLGTAVLPAIPPADAAISPPPWLFQIQATAGGANASTIDCDCIVTVPADEDMLVVEVPGATLPSLGSWVADFNRAGRQSCVITPTAGGTATAYASLAGAMSAGQGDALYVVMAEISDSHGHYITDIAHTAFTIAATLQPAYESV